MIGNVAWEYERWRGYESEAERALDERGKDGWEAWAMEDDQCGMKIIRFKRIRIEADDE